MWEVHLYKLVGATRYKAMAEYDEHKYFELKLRNERTGEMPSSAT